MKNSNEQSREKLKKIHHELQVKDFNLKNAHVPSFFACCCCLMLFITVFFLYAVKFAGVCTQRFYLGHPNDTTCV